MKFSNNQGGGDFHSPEPGSFAAICYKIIDIGTHTDDFQGKTRTKREMIVGWELEEKMEDGKPFVTSQFFSMSLHEKSNLRKALEAWGGQAMTAEQVDNFDPKKMLGRVCLLNLIKNKAGKVVVGSVSKLPKSMAIPVQVNPNVYFDLDAFDQATFDAFSDGMKRLIVGSAEYIAMQQTPKAPPPPPDPGATGSKPPDDDIPF